MIEQEISQRREQLDAAFRKIDFPPEWEVHLHGAVNDLCKVDTSGKGTAPERFRVKSSAGGRPVNLRANAVTTITANAFLRLTGRLPTLTITVIDDDLTPLGQFFEVLQEVFDILGLKESAEHCGKRAMREFTTPGVVKKTRKKKTLEPKPEDLDKFPVSTPTPDVGT
jgi:hypothetical protein